VFVEQAVDYPVDSARKSRWWAANGYGGSVMLPLIMVDSGNQISNGYLDYETVYRGLIDSALDRAPGAAIDAVVSRVGDSLSFDVDVTNLSGVDLSGANLATLNVIIYDANSASGLTGSYLVTSTSQYISPTLLNGASGSYSLQTGDLTGVDWSSLHAVVFLEYRPEGSTHYDMLQLAMEIDDGTTVDAIQSLQIVSGMTPSGIDEVEDINSDGKIGLEEAIHALQ